MSGGADSCCLWACSSACVFHRSGSAPGWRKKPSQYISYFEKKDSIHMADKKKMTMGVIIGNRGFFPDQLAKAGREEMIQALAKAGVDCIVLGPDDSKHGAVETHEEAKRCAALFRKHSD